MLFMPMLVQVLAGTCAPSSVLLLLLRYILFIVEKKKSSVDSLP
jgi:hypothetical protein